MTTPTSRRERTLNPREKKLIWIFFFLVISLIAGYCLIILPQAWTYVRKIQTIEPDTVTFVSITRMQRVEAQLFKVTQLLPSAQIPAFIKLIAEAEAYSPEHPNYDHEYLVEIKTTNSDEAFRFLILPTNNNGTLIWINSEGKEGWHYGALRVDDEVRQLFEAIPFRKQ